MQGMNRCDVRSENGGVALIYILILRYQVVRIPSAFSWLGAPLLVLFSLGAGPKCRYFTRIRFQPQFLYDEYFHYSRR